MSTTPSDDSGRRRKQEDPTLIETPPTTSPGKHGSDETHHIVAVNHAASERWIALPATLVRRHLAGQEAMKHAASER
ncbi:hypothetical protein E2C01_034703 [Portunus trituberculatus]|uniref:Uncharacterized protein n=1 Tax=Portunus trituberculatus TaxID=210409 RepID=A0A5B7F7B2_PORTR|nr:hypothetical protein [Portunus trituberculatus]